MKITLPYLFASARSACSIGALSLANFVALVSTQPISAQSPFHRIKSGMPQSVGSAVGRSIVQSVSAWVGDGQQSGDAASLPAIPEIGAKRSSEIWVGINLGSGGQIGARWKMVGLELLTSFVARTRPGLAYGSESIYPGFAAYGFLDLTTGLALYGSAGLFIREEGIIDTTEDANLYQNPFYSRPSYLAIRPAFGVGIQARAFERVMIGLGLNTVTTVQLQLGFCF